MKFISGLAIIFGGIIALFLPQLKRKNEELQQQNEQQETLIKEIKDAEEIKSGNASLSKSELIDRL